MFDRSPVFGTTDTFTVSGWEVFLSVLSGSGCFSGFIGFVVSLSFGSFGSGGSGSLVHSAAHHDGDDVHPGEAQSEAC